LQGRIGRPQMLAALDEAQVCLQRQQNTCATFQIVEVNVNNGFNEDFGDFFLNMQISGVWQFLRVF
jgi:hypothetical protein